MVTGYVEEAKAWGVWLRRAVAGPIAEMQIMYGISGERNLLEWSPEWLPGYEDSAPVRVGNAAAGQRQLDIAGEMIGVLHLARQHDLQERGSAWARQVEFVDHLLSIWQEPDEGVWEVRGGRQHFTMSKVMTWVALDRSIDDAERGRFEARLDHWRAERDRMHADICASGYDPARDTFTQSYGRPALDASLLGIVLSGFLPPDDPRVLGTVAAIERDLLVDGLMFRYRTDEAGGDGLTGGEGAFLACSFWLVEAYVALGRRDEAVMLFERLIALANDVGLLAEEYDAQKGRQLGNFPQAFSHLALIVAAVSIESGMPLRSGHAA